MSIVITTSEQRSPRTILAFTAFLSALPIALVVAFPAQLNRMMDPASYVVFHNIAEFFSIMVSLSIFGVGWYTFDRSQDRHALFLSAVFLAVGLLDFMHTLGNAAMPAFLTSNSPNKSTQYWIAARLFQAFSLLASVLIYPESRSRWLSKRVLMTSALAVCGLVFTGVTYFPEFVPDTFASGTGLTPFKKNSEYLVTIMLCVAAAAYWRRMARTGDRVLIYYLAAFIICMFSEIVFAIYTRVFDTYNVLGHVYKVAAFSLIYKGIFIVSVTRPYVKLADLAEQLQTTTVSKNELSKEMEERKRTEDALRQSEARYRSLFENMLHGFAHCKMVYDEGGRSSDFIYLDVNNAFGTLTGLENVVGKKATEVIPGIREAHPELLDIYGRVALTGKPEKFDIEFRPLEAWLSISAYSPAREHFVAIFDNITGRKKYEQEVLKLSEDMSARNLELESANREMEAFIYSVSHDLRAPLRSISGFSKIVSEDYSDKLDAQGRDYLARIYHGSEKMTRLISDLLHLSKLSRQELDRMDFDLSKLAENVVQGLREACPERNVEISIAEGLRASVDPNLMRSVLTNLLDNAWKFTSRTEKARIEFGAVDSLLRSADCGLRNETTSTEVKHGKTVYYVRDNGAGFDPTYAEKMFWPFHRLHTEKEFEGIGIGLAIVDRIIRRHGGKAWAEGEVGKGATVFFTMG